jgi:hypothetical protein
MTGSAPISFNGTESGDRVSANTSCWFASQAMNRQPPDGATRPGDQNCHRASLQFALRRLHAKAQVKLSREHADASSRTAQKGVLTKPESYAVEE